MTGQIDELKRKRLKTVLRKVKGNRTFAAEQLGVSVRTVRNWINKFDLLSEYPPVRGKPAGQ